MLPAFHEDLILIHEQKRGHGHTISVLGQEFANRGQTVKPLDATIGQIVELAIEDRVGGQESEDAIKHDRSFRVVGGELCGEFRWGDVGARTSLGYKLQEVKFDG